jgi:hypothetical protein
MTDAPVAIPHSRGHMATPTNASVHAFHIPVMGTGFSLDTPLRLGRFGISSVMSLVNDLLVERVRRHYAARAGLDKDPLGAPILATESDVRARRMAAWLDLVDVLLARQMEEIRALPFLPGNDKTKYFELLPDGALKNAYLAMLAMPDGAQKTSAQRDLTGAMVPGSADANIMTKLDRLPPRRDGVAPDPDQSDAKAALRGFAMSRLRSDLVLSAGINPTLYGLLERFPCFYRDETGVTPKGIILKVSDYRSALVQGKFLAKKGIAIRELRIESGLNCGGHLFATDGELLGPIVEELCARRDELAETLEPMIVQYYKKRGKPYVGEMRRIRLTVQGGIGTHGEARRLCEHYGADAAGWGTPFLLVREATAVDDATRAQLAAAKEADVYVSEASPLGVLFSTLRGSSSEVCTKRRIDEGKPGSGCPDGHAALSTEFTQEPLCFASREYQTHKLAALGYTSPPPADTPDERVQTLYARQCICRDLGNGALINLGLVPATSPVSICPGPNIAWFDREYTLQEMVDHIYGRRESLVPASRPHCLAKELELYVDHFVERLAALPPDDVKGRERLATFEENLRRGVESYRKLAAMTPYEGENLASLARAVDVQTRRLDDAVRRRASGACVCGAEVAPADAPSVAQRSV